MTMTSDEIIRAERLELRPAEHVAVAGGRTLALSVKEMEVLVALARRRDRVISREDLYQLVWGAPMRSTERAVDVYVHRVRSKLRAVLPEVAFIHTHFGLGYRFAPEPSQRFHTTATSP
jgi:DNA-binding response OmpR family regulator